MRTPIGDAGERDVAEPVADQREAALDEEDADGRRGGPMSRAATRARCMKPYWRSSTTASAGPDRGGDGSLRAGGASSSCSSTCPAPGRRRRSPPSRSTTARVHRWPTGPSSCVTQTIVVPPATSRASVSASALLGLRVDAGGGLVEEEQLGLGRRGRGRSAPGAAGRRTARQRRAARVGQAHGLDGGGDVRPGRPRRSGATARRGPGGPQATTSVTVDGSPPASAWRWGT